MNTTKLRFVEEEPLSIAERKKRLRAFMKQRRAQNENRDIKELALLENFEQCVLSKMQGAGTSLNFFVYLSYSSEAPTDKLIEKLIESGHKVYCPRVDGQEMYAVAYGEDFTISDYGIREPVGERYGGELGVLVMPLLAVDETGNRLGYGGGYYDRFIKAYPDAQRIAYCYDFQICAEVPCEGLDEKVQKIVTDKRFLEIE